MKVLTTFFIVVQFMFSGAAVAREQVDLSMDITSTKQGPEAKQDAFDQATEQATKKLAEELVGPEKVAQFWPTVGPKLLKDSTRYVLFIKGSQPLTVSDGAKVTVQIRLAPDALEGVLRELGVFASSSVHLLPLVLITESRGSKYAWWADPSDGKAANLSQDYFKKISQQINAQFKGKSTFVLDPSNASFRMGVPAAYRTEDLRREDQALLAQYLKAEVLLTGKISIVRVRPEGAEQKIDYDLQLWQAKSGRPIAEATHSETAPSDVPKVIATVLAQADKKVFGQLAAKLAEAVGSGNLNLNTMRVSVLGNLSFRQQSEFRKQFSDLREVRALKERLFEPQRVVYEIETPVSSGDLVKAVERAHFKSFSVNVESNQDDGLVLGVRATSAQ